MRIIENGKLQAVKCLGEIPDFLALQMAIDTLDVTSEDTRVSEPVFFGTHRLVGETTLGPDEQVYAKAKRLGVLNEIAAPIVQFLMGVYPGTVPALIQCATIKPGQVLQWHIDTYLYQSVSHKVHIPIHTNAQAKYEYKGLRNGSEHFEIGKAYEINNMFLHRSLNDGSTLRTHLIIDMMIQTELTRFLAKDIDPIFTHHPVNKQTEQRLKAKYAI